MATSSLPKQAPGGPPDLDAFEHHWQDEADAAFLYRLLADAEPDPSKQDIYRRLADVEDRHLEIWADLLAKNGRTLGPHRPTARTRLLAFLGRRFGPGFLLPMLLAEEGREVKAYLDMHRKTLLGVPGRDEALLLAKESAEHASTLNAVAGRTGEPWHKTGAGGFLRNVVYGFNDGLTANFGLVAGVIGVRAAADGLPARPPARLTSHGQGCCPAEWRELSSGGGGVRGPSQTARPPPAEWCHGRRLPARGGCSGSAGSSRIGPAPTRTSGSR